MAEIKSTLDLVLERTKNLTISEEERKTLKCRKVAGKIRGLVQKHLDGILELGELLQEIEAAGSGTPCIPQILAAETAGRLNPMQDQERLSRLMEALFPGGAKAVGEAAEGWKKAVLQDRRDYAAGAVKRWKEKNISGEALIPNLEKDPAWKTCYQKRLKAFREEAASLLAPAAHSDK